MSAAEAGEPGWRYHAPVRLDRTPRVLFLPGASGDGRFWQPVTERLPATWDCVRLDWPGLGRVPPDPTVTGLDDLVARVLHAIDGPADLVAQSMGGVVAVRVALARPDLVRRLVLTATSGGVDVARFGAEDWRADYAREFPGVARWILEERSDLTERIPTIQAPTLLLWGDADPISPVAIGRHLAQLLPRAALVVVPGGDHMFARDRAPEVASHILRHPGVRFDSSTLSPRPDPASRSFDDLIRPSQ